MFTESPTRANSETGGTMRAAKYSVGKLAVFCPSSTAATAFSVGLVLALSPALLASSAWAGLVDVTFLNGSSITASHNATAIGANGDPTGAGFDDGSDPHRTAI